MADACVVFWNVANLFEPGAVARGPATERETRRKARQVADILNAVDNGAPPHAIGLAEVGTRRLFDRVIDGLAGDYLRLWVDPGTATQTGLGLALRTDWFADARVVDIERPTMFSRPRCMLVEAELVGQAEPILIAVNHWKSRMPHGGTDPTADQQETARWLGDRLAAADRTTCVIAMGDFNAEPFEPPFREAGLRGVRFFSTTLWTGATPAYLYNTAWRMLAEPDHWEDLVAAGQRVTRPRTSHDASPPVIFDHLLVSKRALRGGPLRLKERSVRYHVVDGLTSRRSGSGNLTPMRWRYADDQDCDGCSDHYPLVALFEAP